jgi:hypothetical protein
MTFAAASSVMLTAIPDDFYMFTGWTGGCSYGTTTSLYVNSVLECGATFAPTVPISRRTLLTLNNPFALGPSYTRRFLYNRENSLWNVTALDNNGLIIKLQAVAPTQGVNWTLEFRAPAGQTMHEGTYFSESPAPPGNLAVLTFFTGGPPFRTSPPGLEIYGGEYGRCGDVVGRLIVHQIEFDSRTGAVAAFAADFEQRCGTSAPISLTGTINYRATFEIPCRSADPFTSLGDGQCYNLGWLPPGMEIPGTASNPTPPSPPTSPVGCTTADPFASLGGGTCFNGGWLPPGMTPPGGGTNPPPPSPPPTGCTIPDPFVSLGGGRCRNGGWLPPGMQ